MLSRRSIIHGAATATGAVIIGGVGLSFTSDTAAAADASVLEAENTTLTGNGGKIDSWGLIGDEILLEVDWKGFGEFEDGEQHEMRVDFTLEGWNDDDYGRESRAELLTASNLVLDPQAASGYTAFEAGDIEAATEAPTFDDDLGDMTGYDFYEQAPGELGDAGLDRDALDARGDNGGQNETTVTFELTADVYVYDKDADGILQRAASAESAAFALTVENIEAGSGAGGRTATGGNAT